MSKIKKEFSCSSCGYKSPKWLGRCPQCSNWDTFNEKFTDNNNQNKKSLKISKPVKIAKALRFEKNTHSTHIGEFDRVLGGGLEPDSTVLVSGDPGIGKSTLLLQVLKNIADTKTCLYVSGEESASQIKKRADRIDAISENLYILHESSAERILEIISELKPAVVVLDSVQTIQSEYTNSVVGNTNQIKEISSAFIDYAKHQCISVFFIGHVTKDRQIAGPMALEHMVDTVIYFEGDSKSQYRILRSMKNRFGNTNEIGIFEMTQKGLQEVKNPSGIFLGSISQKTPGSVIMSNMEGSRPFLIEVQALSAPSGYAVPSRISTGFDRNRVLLLLAIIEKKLNLKIHTHDVYVNITGGVKITERAGDLPITCAILSSFSNKILPKKTAIFGEIGLTGEIRASRFPKERINEAHKLNFERCILPYENLKNSDNFSDKIELIGVKSIEDVFTKIFSI